MNQRLVSDRVPYIPIRLSVRGVTAESEALLDTGFDEDLIVPEWFSASLGSPDWTNEFALADGAIISCPVYLAVVRVGHLGPFPIAIAALADEYLLGLRLANRFRITLDHGRQLIVEQ